MSERERERVRQIDTGRNSETGRAKVRVREIREREST